jgi:NTP pyrophosphatase (non-canonical NTP hydrolase)
MCNKEMDKVAHWVAGQPIGPKCFAKRFGGVKIPHKVTKNDQPNLFEETMINEEFTHHVSRLFIKPEDHMGLMVHASMGIAGEAGEVVDAIKKAWIYGKELDRENILEECGDLMFYITALLTETGYTLEEAMQANMAKLAKRYPQGYTDKAAIDRADKL